MGGCVQGLRSGLVLVIAAAVVFGLLLVGRAVSTPASTVSAAAPVVAGVEGRQVLVKVKGKRYGKKAKVTLKGYRGKARGVKRTVRVKNTKTVKRLKPGGYKVTAKKIRSNGAVAKAKRIKPRRVRVTKNRGARVRITYRQIKRATPPTTPPTPAPTRPPTSAPGTITRVSIDKFGTQGNDHSAGDATGGTVLSADGSTVAFHSYASNLVPGDTNNKLDVFVKNVATGAITRVSTDKDGNQANSGSHIPALSADGRTVAFSSRASNLVPNDTNNTVDVFVRNVATGAVTRVSTDKDGNQVNSGSYNPVLSADGRTVAFHSRASDLVPDNTNNKYDVFVKNVATGVIKRVSTDKFGNQADNGSNSPVLSADGRTVAFSSEAANLVPNDANNARDVFVKNVATGVITRVSTDKVGDQGNDDSSFPVLSADGRTVAFESYASDLVPNDTNNARDVFVKNVATGVITRVSTDNDGNQSNSGSSSAGLSADGGTVAFDSYASDLVPNDTNGKGDVFVKNVATGVITRVSTDKDSNQANSGSYWPVLSADGRTVAFESHASDLVPNDTNNKIDVFVKVVG